ncbi:heterokaryon incompatibility protein-domain-containing protein [Nemania abortiva]|nr:heterokaryon incompatibility protein-domain-containing protein [Nemania abortiva]
MSTTEPCKKIVAFDVQAEDSIQEKNSIVATHRYGGPPFEYSVLLHSDSIRVFILAPSSDITAPIYGEIVELRLSDGRMKHDYIALSYVWGSNNYTHEIQVGDYRFNVTRNLNLALRNLRRKDRCMRLWVDAICINQNDVNERNHQVQQMRRIYSSALETIIYLGGSTGGHTGCSAWNFLERHATWATNENGDPDPNLPANKEKEIYFCGELLDVEIDVLARPWFRRLWVLQEAVVSKALSIQCGLRRISWDDFCKAVLLTPRYSDQYGFNLNRTGQIETVRDIFQARCEYHALHGMGHLLPSWSSQVQMRKRNTLDILNLLQRTRLHQTSDPRDKIYGLLGVASGIDVYDQGFVVDYNQDCRNVYMRFARNLIHASRNYSLLSYVDHSPFRYRSLMVRRFKLPSWVPNWDLGLWADWLLVGTPSVLSTLDPEPNMEMSEGYRLFDRFCTWIDSGETLVACGSMIGEIRETSYVIRLNGAHEIKFQGIRDSGISEHRKRDLIMEEWRHLSCAVVSINMQALAPRGDLRYRASPTPHWDFGSLLSMCWGAHTPSLKQQPERGTVERHLLARSRKTTSWSNNQAVSEDVLVDETSIVDGKRLAVYSVFGAPDVLALAIVPASTIKGDFLVDLRGGRVPFVVNVDKGKIPDGDEDPNTDFGLRDCKLVGESVVNRVPTDDLVWRERVFVIH